jgi:quercetin dioxygenase-like cupin family protein
MNRKMEEYTRQKLWRDKQESWKEVLPGVKRRILAHSLSGMAALYRIAPNTVFPLHSHPHAQYGFVLEGEGVFKVGNSIWKLAKGDSYFIPPGVPHELTTKGDKESVIIDFFTPEREDMLNEALQADEY